MPHCAQTQLINLLQRDRRCITVVGDDAQSIYSFRCARQQQTAAA